MYLHQENIPWDKLTQSLKKKNVYSSDFYFELSYEAALQSIQSDIVSKINAFTLLFIKPETLLTKKIEVLIEDLQKHHFKLVYASIRSISHVQISELWKYAWSAASIIRIIINQMYYTKFDCGILILQNTQCGSESASSFLSKIKGKPPYSEPHIRYHMNAINIFLNYIHSPDDNADFMREAAIFFSWDELTEIYRRIQSNITIPFQTLRNMTKKYPYCVETTTPENALNVLIQKVSDEMEKSFETDRKIFLSDIYRELLSIKNKKSRFTHVILENMRKADVLEWDWSLFIVITHYMEYATKHNTLF